MFAIFLMHLGYLYISAVLFLFHPYYGYFAIFSAIILLIIAIAITTSTKEKLKEANKAYLHLRCYL